MKKIISQISLILLIMVIGITSVFITEVNAASSAGLNVSSATEGGTFTVSLILPDANVVGANCDIEVIFSDGTKTNVGTNGETGIAYIKGGEALGAVNLITFSAKVAGQTLIKATNISISDANGVLLEEGGTKEQTITIAAKNPEPAPEQNGNQNEESSGNIDSSNNTNNNSNPNTNTTQNNEVKEPEIVMPTFKDVNETVYATKGANVRSSCSTEISSNKIGGLLKGQEVKRTGIEDTWSRIEFNGKTAYVATRLLTTEKPEEEPVENTVNENTVKNTVSNENIVTNNSVQNNIVVNNEISEEEMLNQIQQQIGVLPEVGINIATIMFICISIFSLIIIMKLKYKSIE